ncbi:MCE family protein [Streptomyces polyrhachis]|uniref:MCE family protein n=1 Tax=Streptomyces polyrhachis TaxID=1282885 RepID=A0ABW2GJ59_9ACTN
MLTLSTHLRNLAFLLLGAVVLSYIGVVYADVGRYVGVRDYYTVSVELPAAAGVYPNSNVTYRGVDVGRIGAIDLTADGVRAQVRIDKSSPDIPADLKVTLANLSAVGEQYLELTPNSDGAPYLHDGSTVLRTQTTLPPPVTEVLDGVNELSGSVDLDDLRTVVDELGTSFQGRGQDLQILVRTGAEFIDAAYQALPDTTSLLVDSQTVLRTQNANSRALKDFGKGINQLAKQLETSDADIRTLIQRTPEAANQFTGLLRDTDPGFSLVLANLLTTSELLFTRQRGTEELLVRIPRIAAAGATAVGPTGVQFGLVPTFFQPLPCVEGYGGTTYRNGLDSADTVPNTGATCTASPQTGKNVRGSGNAPGGGSVPAPATPGAPVDSAHRDSSSATSTVDLGGRSGLEE